MKTIDITLPDDLQAFAQSEAARRGFKDSSAFMQSLLEAEKHRQIRQELEALLLNAADGPFSEWTDHDLDDIRRQGRRLIERRKAL
jgi:Arc/MetJ-type ribon-helix-helix transcriptional regulator